MKSSLRVCKLKDQMINLKKSIAKHLVCASVCDRERDDDEHASHSLWFSRRTNYILCLRFSLCIHMHLYMY